MCTAQKTAIKNLLKDERKSKILSLLIKEGENLIKVVTNKALIETNSNTNAFMRHTKLEANVLLCISVLV